MAVNHLQGTTSYGAADKIVEFFATFTAWLVGTVGWTLEAAPTDVDRVFSSTGEGAAYTRLFFRIWQDPGTNHIRGEVRNDAAGTQETTGLGFIDADQGEVFRYYIVADLDTVLFTVPYRGTTTFLYLGCLEPAAITPINETYYMVASETPNALDRVSLLRWHTGAWDRLLVTSGDQANPGQCLVPGNESLALSPLYAEDHADCAGQLKFIGRPYTGTANLGNGDRLATQTAGDAVWQIFGTGAGGSAFAILVAGTQPTEQNDGASFFYTTQMPAGRVAFMAAFTAAMVSAGWTSLGDPGGPHTFNQLFWSEGEDGTKDIFLLFCLELGGWPTFHLYAQGDAIGTNRTLFCSDAWWNVDLPFTFWFAGDKDCFSLFIDNYWAGGPNNPKTYFWGGVPSPPVAPIPDGLSFYNTVVYNYGGQFRLLRRRAAIPGGAVTFRDHAGTYSLTNGNNFDANSYFVWPQSAYEAPPFGGNGGDYLGDMRYYGYTDGGGVANLDTITVGAIVYLILDINGAGICRAIRSV